jgi:hypothetical protein
MSKYKIKVRVNKLKEIQTSNFIGLFDKTIKKYDFITYESSPSKFEKGETVDSILDELNEKIESNEFFLFKDKNKSVVICRKDKPEFEVVKTK